MKVILPKLESVSWSINPSTKENDWLLKFIEHERSMMLVHPHNIQEITINHLQKTFRFLEIKRHYGEISEFKPLQKGKDSFSIKVTSPAKMVEFTEFTVVPTLSELVDHQIAEATKRVHDYIDEMYFNYMLKIYEDKFARLILFS